MWQRRKGSSTGRRSSLLFIWFVPKGRIANQRNKVPEKIKQKLGIKSDISQNDKREGGCSIKVIKIAI
jgi:hypothetical protein